MFGEAGEAVDRCCRRSGGGVAQDGAFMRWGEGLGFADKLENIRHRSMPRCDDYVNARVLPRLSIAILIPLMRYFTI
jgi:hypothetical protein